MPQASNIVVKKNDGTTDVAYTSMIASAGDNSPALWRNLTVGTAAAHRPSFQTVSKDNGAKTGRRVDGSFVWPQIATGTDGKINVVNKLPISFSALVPKDMPDTEVNEAVSQAFNLFASTLNKDQVKQGFAAT